MGSCGFGELLRVYRHARGLTLTALSDASGISRTSLNLYEKGVRTPNVESLCSLCDSLDVSADVLIGRTEAKLPAPMQKKQSCFGEILADIRIGRGLTQADVAKGAGLSQNTIFAYETGRREPSLGSIKKIADYFGISAAVFFGETETEE